MTRLSIKSLWARKVRAFATSLAVILGVAFIAGSYVLTDTIFAAFDEIFTESLQGTSVVSPRRTRSNRKAAKWRRSRAPTCRRCRGSPG